MSTNVEISSNALLLIGDTPIASFSDPGAGPKAANDLYQITKDALLAEHPWSFAMKSAKLVDSAQTPDPLLNYKYAMTLPSDMIRIWGIYPLGTGYMLEGPIMYTNNNDILLSYVYSIDESLMPPHFEKTLEYKLAGEFAVTVTESMSMSESMGQKYLKQLARARNIDSQGRPQMAIVDQPFTDVRLNGFTHSSYG